MKKKTVLFLFLGFIYIFTGCVFDDDDDPDTHYNLQLLHFSDIDGNEDLALNNLDEFSSVVDGFRKDEKYGKSTLLVSSGDNIIPGPRFYAAEQDEVSDLTGSNEPGHADIAFLNELEIAASAIGNHELDAGPGEFADAVKADNSSQKAKFPHLSVNIDFSRDNDFGPGKDVEIGVEGDLADLNAGKIAKSTIVEINGESIGIVGAVTPDLPQITTTGDLVVTPSGNWTNKELAAIIQPSVDLLTAKGVNKIILLAHMQQLSVEKELAELLNDVDIIVAGGSNTLLADDNDKLLPGDKPADTYPLKFKSPKGETVLVVNVDGDYKYIGRLVTPFDKDGKIISSKLDSKLNGAWAATASNAAELGGTPDKELIEIRDAVKSVINSQYGNVVGYTKVYLDGRRSQVRTEETNLGNLTANANLWYANLLSDEIVDVSIKNGGGIRTEIGTAVIPPGSTDPSETKLLPPQASQETGTSEGAVTEGHLRAALRFDNGLTCLTATASELKDIMEHAVAAISDGATPGQFPQIAGMRIAADPSKPPRTSQNTGSRIIELVTLNPDLTDKDIIVKNGVIQGNPQRTFRLVTLNFLANGGDSYPFDLLTNPARTNLYLGQGYGDPADFPDETLENDPGKNNDFSKTGGEQDALAEYFMENFPSYDKAYDKEETDGTQDSIIKIIQ